VKDGWWRTPVIYQVYWRSFLDSNGDGLGDLGGLQQGLDHLVDLGVDGIWLNPMFPSPQKDHGYDVANYVDVEPTFGELEAFVEFVSTCHERGLFVLLDIVPNHCSSAHPWFVEAMSAPDHPLRSRFHLVEGRGEHGEHPPNDWQSIFGGPAWTRVVEADGSLGPWYLHMFDSSQPELNWNDPAVWDDMEDVLRFWFDRGIDGFRIDVAHGPIKAPGYPEPTHPTDAFIERWDQPGIHDVYKRWRAIADGYRPERMFIGEVHVGSTQRMMEYLGPDGLHLAFQFSFIKAEWSKASLEATIDEALEFASATASPANWVLSNHDEPRHVSRFAPKVNGDPDLKRGNARARSLLMMMLSLPGTVTLYNGEELGLPEVTDVPDDARQDPAFFRQPEGSTYKGRDGCRIPMPWVHGAPHAGFSTTTSWLPMPEGWDSYAVDLQQQDPSSMLSFYREALALRRATLAGNGEVTCIDLGPEVLAYTVAWNTAVHRIVVNLGEVPLDLDLDGATVLLMSQPDAFINGSLAPDAGVWTSKEAM
jgi:alpha-glucosidase